MSYFDNDRQYIIDNISQFFSNNKQGLINVTDKIKNNSNKILMITMVIIILIIIIIVILNIESVRVPRCLKDMDIFTNERIPIINNPEIMTNDYRLCDFVVASAYRCYLPCSHSFDYASVESVKKCILKGARYLHFDIFPNKFGTDAEPIVCNGREEGNWHWTTSINFEDVCKVINEYALGMVRRVDETIVKVNNATITNTEDPLFIHLNFKCWNNRIVIDKCADILLKYFRTRMLDTKYSYCGINSNTNIALTPIKELVGKVIIVCDAEDVNDITYTKMYELSNLSSKLAGNLRLLSSDNVKNTYSINELTDYCKQNMVIVYPGTMDNRNYNFYTPWYIGCQFISMNFTNVEPFMKNYLGKDTRFMKYSIVLKPKQLRYKPILIDPPVKQNPNVSFKPDTLTTGYGSFTI